MDKKILIKCKAYKTTDYQNFNPFQGDLKSLSVENFERLKGNILRDGFNAPIEVWNDGEKLYTLDGHQRCRVLDKMLEEGYEIPKIPYVLVEANSYTQAKRILLDHSSNFGKVEEQGLYEYMHDSKIELPELKERYDLPALDTEKFGANFFNDNEGGGQGITPVNDQELKNMLSNETPDELFKKEIKEQIERRENIIEGKYQGEFLREVAQRFIIKTLKDEKDASIINKCKK